MKIEEQVLSIEQMKHLQELGVDTSDASMYWVRAKRIIGKQRNNVLDNEMGKWSLSLSKSIVHSVDWAVESVPTYTIGDLIEKLSNAIISYYEFRVTIKNHSTESVFMEDKVIEDYVTGRNPKDALYKALCLVAKHYPELLKVKTSKKICCEEIDDELQLTT